MKQETGGINGSLWLIPRVRFELGLPILRYSEEVAYYGIESRYTRDYWHNHYLCLWEVTPEEIVGIWYWNDLRQNPSWYENVIMPAAQQHRESKIAHQPRQGKHKRDVYEEPDSSDALDDTDDDTYWSDSDGSDERVCNENWTGEVMKMWENLRIN